MLNRFVSHAATGVGALQLASVFVLICACEEQLGAATLPPPESDAAAAGQSGSHVSSANAGAGGAGESGSHMPSAAGSESRANGSDAQAPAPSAAAAGRAGSGTSAAGAGAGGVGAAAGSAATTGAAGNGAATSGASGSFAFPSQDTVPNDDSFYRPPTLSGQPGDILRSRESPFVLDALAQVPEADVMVRQVLYQSTDALDKPMAVSGTILIPKAAWIEAGNRPLVSYAVGTRGLGDACAPSYTLAHAADYEGSVVRSLLDRGWAVAVTDYQASGTPGVHTYMAGRAEAHAVLDIARAAQRLDGSGLSKSTPVGLTGYSQGGGAAGWAAQLAPSYAPELNIKGAAIGGVPADLKATAEFLDGTTFVAFALMASLGLDAAYPELNLDSYLNDRGRDLVAVGEQTCLATLDGFATLLGETAETRLDDYVTTNPLGTPPWQARLAENKLGETNPSVPVFQYHAEADEIVPFDQAAELRRTWCSRGVDLTWEIIPFEHALGIALGPPLAIEWLADRFANLPTQSNCQAP